jgi:hypothetical protein
MIDVWIAGRMRIARKRDRVEKETAMRAEEC